MKGKFQGTWETTGGGGGGVVLVIVLVLLLGSGAVAAVSAVLIGIFIAVAVTVVLALAAGGYLVYRAYRRQQSGIPAQRGIVGSAPRPGKSFLLRPLVVHQLSPEPEQPAIAPAQHFHLHVGEGADPAQVAAVMRQVRGERD